eukprot:scaffold6913_cov114-Isochrysis_galbana.AAC.4
MDGWTTHQPMLLLPFASDPHSSPDCLPAPLLGLPGRQQDADDLAVQQVLRVPVVILHLEVFVLGVEALDAPFEPAVAGEVFCDGPAHQAVRLLQLELAQRVERQILLVAIRVEQAESVLGVIGGDLTERGRRGGEARVGDKAGEPRLAGGVGAEACWAVSYWVGAATGRTLERTLLSVRAESRGFWCTSCALPLQDRGGKWRAGRRTAPTNCPYPTKFLTKLRPTSAAGGGTLSECTSDASKLLSTPPPGRLGDLLPPALARALDGVDTACACTMRVRRAPGDRPRLAHTYRQQGPAVLHNNVPAAYEFHVPGWVGASRGLLRSSHDAPPQLDVLTCRKSGRSRHGMGGNGSRHGMGGNGSRRRMGGNGSRHGMGGNGSRHGMG